MFFFHFELTLNLQEIAKSEQSFLYPLPRFPNSNALHKYKDNISEMNVAVLLVTKLYDPLKGKSGMCIWSSVQEVSQDDYISCPSDMVQLLCPCPIPASS